MSAFYVFAIISAACLVTLGYLLFLTSQKLTRTQKQLIEAKADLLRKSDVQSVQNAEIVELKNKIATTIMRDVLTGLPGRQIFDEQILREISQSKRHHLIFAVVFLNLDGFKIINNALGFEAGDELLKEVAARLQANIRQVDILTRFSGDEFVLMLPQLSKPETAAYAAQRLLDAVAVPFQIQHQEIFITASVGIAVYPMDGEEAKVLLQNADLAMRLAKVRGRNNYQFHRPDTYDLSRRELTLTASLYEPMLYKNFLLYYQPIVSCETKKIISMEAILKWKHPDFGLIEWVDFVRLAENTHHIVPIGEWVLSQACQQFQIWKSLGIYSKNLTVSVSIRQLENPHYIYKLSQILQEFNLEPTCLMLELSEATLLAKIGIVEKTLLMLKQLGIQIGISDFGTGNIALRQLHDFPIDNLTIASNLIQNMTVNKEVAAIVKMIIALANTLNLKVTAAGTESQKQVQLLKEMGCHLIQGSIISPPMLPDEFSPAIERSIVDNILQAL